MSLTTSGCLPTTTPSIGKCVIEIAERYEFNVRYCLPSAYSLAKKSRIELKGAQTGLHPDEAHHRSHLLQLQEYAASVAFRHEDKMRLDAAPEIP